jgi:malate/lactate dehydrogenase
MKKANILEQYLEQRIEKIAEKIIERKLKGGSYYGNTTTSSMNYMLHTRDKGGGRIKNNVALQVTKQLLPSVSAEIFGASQSQWRGIFNAVAYLSLKL